MRKSPNPAHMSLEEVADAIGRRPDTIKKYRMNPNCHPFFRKAFKTGTGRNSPLRWWRQDVDEYLRTETGRGDRRCGVMLSRDELADLIADVMMPGAPGLVLAEAQRISDAILTDHAVVSLPPSSYEDDQGISWDSDDGVPLATASSDVVWVHDGMLEVDEAEEWAGVLLAAARASRGARR